MEQENQNEDKAELLDPPEVTIDLLASLSDAELGKALGFDKKLEDARKALDEMQKLTGKAREYAEQRIAERFKPNLYPDDFRWILDDAKRKGKTGMDEMACDEPGSVM